MLFYIMLFYFIQATSFQGILENFKLDDDVTLDGRLFKTFAAATGKARPPMVSRRTRGIMSSAVDSLCQPHEGIHSEMRLVLSKFKMLTTSNLQYGQLFICNSKQE